MGIMKKQRLAAGMLAFAMVLGGCGAEKGDITDGSYESYSGSGKAEVPARYSTLDSMNSAELPKSDADAGLAGGSMESGGRWEEAGDFLAATDEIAEYATEPGTDGFIMEEIGQARPAPGLLTAGEWCDNQNWGFYVNLVKTGRFDFHVYGIKPYERVVVHAVSDGTAVRDAKAVLFDADGEVLAEAVTDFSGTAYLYYHLFDRTVTGSAEPAFVTVQANGSITMADLSEAEEPILDNSAAAIDGGVWQEAATGGPVDGGNLDLEKDGEYQDQGMGDNPGVWEYQQEQGGGGQEIMAVLRSRELTVEVSGYEVPAKRLDLMFVFDTTGSMGDELLYLQKEFEDIAAQVADQSTRFSVNFYRDLDDDYIVRSNEFTSDINEVAALLNAEYADGGGDYEEAVDLALVDAVFGHAWREDGVKLLFLILDAPPHNTAEVAANLERAVSAASAMGIRIIPIASSGVDGETEALLRDMAMVTGGTYTFLTDDSEIGNSHLEPTIGHYTVEALNALIVRLIRQYY